MQEKARCCGVGAPCIVRRPYHSRYNSSTLYELAVLKKYIFPLLREIEPSSDCYDQVRGMVKILNFVCEADVDDEIPPTSIVREFIGGNSFYRK